MRGAEPLTGEQQSEIATHAARAIAEREASGRTQRDSVVAQAVRRRETRKQAKDAQRAQRLEAERTARDAQENNAAAADLAARMAALAAREKALALAGQRERRTWQHERPVATPPASWAGGGTTGMARSCGRTARKEADWRRWQRRFDVAGVREYKGARGSHFGNMMRDLLGESQRGDQWALQPELVVPGALPLPLADGAGAAAGEAAPR